MFKRLPWLISTGLLSAAIIVGYVIGAALIFPFMETLF